MNASVPKRQEENCIGRYSKGLRNQNREHLANLGESKNLEAQVKFLCGLLLIVKRIFLLKLQI